VHDLSETGLANQKAGNLDTRLLIRSFCGVLRCNSGSSLKDNGSRRIWEALDTLLTRWIGICARIVGCVRNED